MSCAKNVHPFSLAAMAHPRPRLRETAGDVYSAWLAYGWLGARIWLAGTGLAMAGGVHGWLKGKGA